MTKTMNIDDKSLSIQAVIALTKTGDEIVLEENGQAVAKVIRIATPKKTIRKRISGLGVKTNGTKQRKLGLGSGEGYWMSEDFNDELPDEFWGFDK
ncbi:MAG: hypothetical protein ACKVRN_00975 [Pyrinomonadaceae bacterium]